MATTCGAKTRDGGECKKAPLNGKTRCKLHGGKSTGNPVAKGNISAVTHGFYSDALLPDEQQLYARAQVGNLDDEIRLARVKLHRWVRLSGSTELMEMIDGATEVAHKIGEAFDQATQSMQPFEKREIKAAAPDYADLIIRQIDLIRKLEVARRDLAADDDEPLQSIRITVKRAVKDDA